MEVTVRRAEEKDIPMILKLLIEVNMVHHNGRPDLFKGPARKYNEDQLKAIFKDETRPIFVGVNDRDEALGYGFCMITEIRDNQLLTDRKELYIDDLCVDESARGMGVGHTIYDAIVAYARDIGCTHLSLHAWTCNPNALQFYRNLGLKTRQEEMELIL